MTRSAALSLLLAVALAAPAGAHTLRRAATPVIVTAGPALAGCPVPPTAQVGAEVEPHVAVDPSDPRRMAVAWQQDRATDGAARALGVALSSDGGRTWRPSSVPGTTDCPASPDERRTDPWLSFAADGDLYLAGVPGQRGDVFAITSVRVERLPRGAREWGIATTADQGPAFNDKEALVADPRRPGVAFVAYTREAAAGWVARTDDGGATWTAPVRAAPGTQSRPALGLVPVVLDDGTVLVVYGDPARGRFRAVRSRDDGATWSAPRVIGGDRPLNEPGDGAGGTLRTTASNPQVGAHGRRVAVAWADVRAKAIRMVVSGDRGRTWRSRRVVTVRGTGTAKPFLPAVAVDRRGVIGVTYHLLLPGRGRRVDVWFAHSHDGGRTWRRARVLGPMSLATAPRAGSSRFLGDYTGLAATGRGFVAALVATGTLAPEGRSDVRVALLRP